MDNQNLRPAGHGEERKAFLAELEGRFDRNEPGAALDLARERLKKSPGDPDARVGICRALVHLGRTGEALQAFEEIEETIAALSQVHACVGDLCIKRGLEDSAEEFYRRSLMLNLGPHWAREILERLRESGETGETGAGKESERETDIPADFQTPTLAELFIRQGHLREAEELLEKILGQEPRNEKASELLREVRGRIAAEAAERRNAEIVSELSRWLDHVGRMRGHAA